MVKEGIEKETREIKKRRKTSVGGIDGPEVSAKLVKTSSVTSPNSSAGSQAKTIKSKIDIYQSIVQFEEAEAVSRSEEKDAALFKETCDDLRQIMREVLELKLKKKDKVSYDSDIAEKRIQASLLFITLKKLNRIEKLRTKHARDVTAEVKQKVDSFHLQLQNLLYEVVHLRKEVVKCLEFKSKDEEINLVSEEEFYKDAPASISRQEVTRADGHQLKLARLEWELEQRKQLAVMCGKLQEDKNVVAQSIATRQEQLDSLAPTLSTILEATKPVQELLLMPLDHVRSQHQLAQLLPEPLFILYAQACGYQEACDKLMTVLVCGESDDAKTFNSVGQTSEVEESDSEAEGETEPAEEGSKRKKRHHRKKSKSDRMEEKKRFYLLHHPLWVEITIKLKDGDSIVLWFYYIVNLHFATVKCKLNVDIPVSGMTAGDLLCPDYVLSGLFPSDYGNESPNSSTNFRLQQAGLEDLTEYISQVGLPYFWVQRLCGLDFIKAKSETEVTETQISHLRISASLSQANMEKTVKSIRRRLEARVSLCHHVQSLESGSVPLNTELRNVLPTKVTSHLTSWRPARFEDYQEAITAQHFIKANLVTCHDRFYRTVVERGTAVMIALVALKPNYPYEAPIFSLNLHWNGERNNSNDDAIRDMERELNVYWTELKGRGRASLGLLGAQMQRLLSCLDIYLESASLGGPAPIEFAREKTFLKPFGAKNRSRPYKYLSGQIEIFIQR